MKIRDSFAFVTGTNRGIGLAFAQELLAAGSRKVYAAARQPERITLAGLSDREGIYLNFDPERAVPAAR